MTTPSRRLGLLLILLLALARHEVVAERDDRKTAVADTEAERCTQAARQTCAGVATRMIASIEATCGHFGLGWACGLARVYWNAPRDKDAEWVDGTCRQEALKQCGIAKHDTHE